jgi:hypothetical protein
VSERTAEQVLKPGDVVEVRSPAEILATLDSDASLDGMPFMPEMLRYSGKRFTVSHRVEKICDTVSGGPPVSRRMRDTVLLEDLRCDGSDHGGCQAGCRLYWKESWIRRVDPDSEHEGRPGDGLAQLEELARGSTRSVRDVDRAQTESYRCQATEALRASEPLSNYDLRQYIRELTSGNAGLLRILRVAVRAMSTPILRRLRVLGYQPLRHRGAPGPGRGELNLQPGDMVEVRSKKEIARTLDEGGKTRGLWFDWEMTPFCGGRYRVKDRVERIIDERTGQMIEIPSDCLILEGVVCSGDRSSGHWLCPRAIYPYWREAWLRRVDDAGLSSSGGPRAETTNP